MFCTGKIYVFKIIFLYALLFSVYKIIKFQSIYACYFQKRGTSTYSFTLCAGLKNTITSPTRSKHSYEPCFVPPTERLLWAKHTISKNSGKQKKCNKINALRGARKNTHRQYKTLPCGSRKDKRYFEKH